MAIENLWFETAEAYHDYLLKNCSLSAKSSLEDLKADNELATRIQEFTTPEKYRRFLETSDSRGAPESDKCHPKNMVTTVLMLRVATRQTEVSDTRRILIDRVRKALEAGCGDSGHGLSRLKSLQDTSKPKDAEALDRGDEFALCFFESQFSSLKKWVAHPAKENDAIKRKSDLEEGKDLLSAIMESRTAVEKKLREEELSWEDWEKCLPKRI